MQCWTHLLRVVSLGLVLRHAAEAQNIILTNDDGWAVAQIRAQFDALQSVGFNVSIRDYRRRF